MAKTKIVDSDSHNRYAVYILDGWQRIGWVSRWEPPMNVTTSFDFRSAVAFDADEAASVKDLLGRFGIMCGVFARTDEQEA